MPIHGTSMAYTFSDSNAKTKRTLQYFEMFGNRGIWSKGWKAVTHHEPGTGYSRSDWELYNLDEDFSESNNFLISSMSNLSEFFKSLHTFLNTLLCRLFGLYIRLF